MKKYLTLMALLFVCPTISLLGKSHSFCYEEKIMVEINKTKIDWTTDIERSLNYSTIEVYMSPQLSQLEIHLFNIGNASLYLLNSNYQIVNSDYVETNLPVIVHLDTFTNHGTFYIVITSPSWYAEGTIIFD